MNRWLTRQRYVSNEEKLEICNVTVNVRRNIVRFLRPFFLTQVGLIFKDDYMSGL